jgi:hypothetical protein
LPFHALLFSIPLQYTGENYMYNLTLVNISNLMLIKIFKFDNDGASKFGDLYTYIL